MGTSEYPLLWQVYTIMQHPWSMMTVLYILSRYLGDMLLIICMCENGPGIIVSKEVRSLPSLTSGVH
ncbi:hypothetical protein K503DRAFT_337078 [Rhizopogon vinicolor AM-OR11-026]|uniref:Uncharacterized protein n=1 Tax=Rhizopogon vinicolor AM-OR11-026 TaxID=1314800 RepID=A0A1B7MTN8_9AGAM|nr:hypothetical protein K503DRAFT_337078 [Rhizopogon vinicolor AM-OR11-026]